MTNLKKAIEIQQIAARFLYEDRNLPYTDVEEWGRIQAFLAKGIGELCHQEGPTPEMEAEIVLAILMGYTIAVRKSRHIDLALQRAERVFSLLPDSMLKCQLAVFCYGECLDEGLLETAHWLIEKLKQTVPTDQLDALEELLLCMEENG